MEDTADKNLVVKWLEGRPRIRRVVRRRLETLRGLRRAAKRAEAFGVSIRAFGLKMMGLGSAVLALLAGWARRFSGCGGRCSAWPRNERPMRRPTAPGDVDSGYDSRQASRTVKT